MNNEFPTEPLGFHGVYHGVKNSVKNDTKSIAKLGGQSILKNVPRGQREQSGMGA